MRTSIGSVIVTPTPTAAPLIAAITGFLHSKMRSVTRPPPSRCSLAASSAAVVEGAAAAAEIGARAEGAPGARHDHDADLVVPVDLVEDLEQLAEHLLRAARSCGRDG